MRNVPYAPLHDISFIGHSAMLSECKKFRTPSPSPAVAYSPSPGPSNASSRSPSPVPPKIKKIKKPNTKEISELYSALSKYKSKPSILSLIKDYSSEYVPKSRNPDLPEVLATTLFDIEKLSMNYLDMLKEATELEVIVTADQSLAAELAIRQQSRCALWFQMRSGRISASNLKGVCHTDPAMPAISLIMTICNPEMSQFKTVAMKYGCDHEKEAKGRYVQESSSPQEFQVYDCGFFIFSVHPFIGASPYGLVHCLCCREEVCEIKAK